MTILPADYEKLTIDQIRHRIVKRDEAKAKEKDAANANNPPEEKRPEPPAKAPVEAAHPETVKLPLEARPSSEAKKDESPPIVKRPTEPKIIAPQTSEPAKPPEQPPAKAEDNTSFSLVRRGRGKPGAPAEKRAPGIAVSPPPAVPVQSGPAPLVVPVPAAKEHDKPKEQLPPPAAEIELPTVTTEDDDNDYPFDDGWKCVIV